jgi:hypothetical protein
VQETKNLNLGGDENEEIEDDNQQEDEGSEEREPKVDFSDDADADSEGSREVQSSTTTAPEPPKKSKQEIAHEHLSAIGKLIKGKNEDVCHRDLGFNRIHHQLIAEMEEQKAKGKKIPLSDGTCEMLSIQHARLKKLNKL